MRRGSVPEYRKDLDVQRYRRELLPGLRSEAGKKWYLVWHQLEARLDNLRRYRMNMKGRSRSLDVRTEDLTKIARLWMALGAHLGLDLTRETERSSPYRCAHAACDARAFS